MDGIISLDQIGSAFNWLTGQVGPAFLKYVDPALVYFRQENVAPTIACCIIAIAFVVWMYNCAFYVLPAIAVLNRRIRFLSKLKDRHAFASNFEQFDVLMNKRTFLRHGWGEFCETLINRDPVIEISVRPSVFLNPGDAEYDGLNVSRLEHMSGIYVSLGLLFTFIGLVAALSLASGTIREVVAGAAATAGDQQAKMIQESLAALLFTASAKFWTSIAGLACSIVFGWLGRRAVHRISGKFDELSRQIERLTMTVTPEILANRTYFEIREQSAHMKEFTGQFRVNISEALQDAMVKAMPTVMTGSVGDALTERMPQVMNDAMVPVVSTLENMTTRLTTMNQEAIKQMTGDFGNVVSQSAGTEIKAVAETLRSMPEQITVAAGDIRSAAQALTDGMNRITEVADRNVGDASRKLDVQLEAAVRALSDAAQAVRETMEQSGQAMRRSGEQAGTAFGNEIADAIRRIEASAENNAATIEMVVDKLAKATSGVTGDMAAESARTMQALRDAVEQMSRTVADVSGNLGSNAVKSAGDVTERFLSAAMSMQEAVNRNSDQVAKAVESIVAAGRQAESSVGKAADDVAVAMLERGKVAAAQVVEGSAQALNGFRSTIDHMSTSTAAAGMNFGAGIAEAVNRIERSTENNALAIEMVVDRLVKATSGVTGDMSAESARTMEALSNVVEQMARTVTDISGNLGRDAVKSADDVTERFLLAAMSMQEAVNRNSDQVAKAVESIVAAGRQAETGVGKAADDVARTMATKGREAAEQVVGGSSEVLTAFQETVTRLWQRVDELTRALATVEQRIGSHASALEGTTRAARETEAAMVGSARSLTTATEPLAMAGEQISRSMTSVGSAVEAAVKGLSDGQRETAKLADELTKTTRELQTIWKQHVGRFDGVDAALEGVFRKVIEHANEHTRKLTQYIADIDTHTAAITGHLSTNVDELRSTVDDMIALAKTIRSR